MNKVQKIKILLSILVFASLPVLTSCRWSGWASSNITKFNGSQFLTNTSYKNLEIHGAAHLTDVHVTGWFKCQGSAELAHTEIDGAVDISGALTTRSGSSIKGIVNAPAINAEGTTFADIFTRSDKNKTYRFVNCSVKNLYVEGLGNKVVIVTNTTIDSITFENPNGIVRLQGTAKVGTITNGAIEG